MRCCPPRRAGRKTTSTPGCGITADSWSSSSPRCSPSRTRPSRLKTASAGAWRPPPRRSSRRKSVTAWTRKPRASYAAGSAARYWSSRARPTRSPGPAAGSPSPPRRAANSCCSRARATARTSVTQSRSTCCCATSPPPPAARPRWVRGRARPKRALYISSPIGLGHAQRDIAIATELRKLHPDLEIDWLAQHPVTRVLEARGERVHPASAYLASESGHIESESAEHDLHGFQAIRRMDEILLANFMVFNDLIEEEPYDLWIGDEAWELDYYLHENPDQKRADYVWLTDF